MADSTVETAKVYGVTENILQTAIKVKEGRDDVVIIEKQVTSGSDTINNFCSVGSFVALKAKVGGHAREYKLFVKKAHEDEGRKWWLLGDLQFFKREATMYSELIPDMVKMQREMCGYAFGPSVPEYYDSIVNRDTGVIILHNCTPDGYSVRNIRKGVDYEHCKLVMKEIAVFHALSWAMKRVPVDYRTKYSFLSKYCVNEYPIENIVEVNVRSVIELVRLRMPDKTAREAILKLSSIDFNKTKKRLVQPIEPFAVICHGDFNMNNILFQSTKNAEFGSPNKLKLIDMQSVIYAPPTTDLAVFFYSSVTRETRKRHIKELLLIYHTEFIQCLKRLNLTFEEFSFSVLEKQFVQSALFGVLMSCLYIPHLMGDREEFNGFAQTTVEGFVKAAEETSKRFPLFCDKYPTIQERLFDNWIELVEMGVL